MDKVKSTVVRLLNHATMAYLRRGNVKVIAVFGSVGKTSTSSAIRTVLAQKYHVHTPTTAYNTDKSVHLQVFRLQFATSVFGWVWVTAKMLLRSLGRPKFDVLVIELGTDHPGEMASFTFLQPHIGVLTAIAPEHMEHFGSVEAVAREELSLAAHCSRLVINQDAVDEHFVAPAMWQAALRYGSGTSYRVAEYYPRDVAVKADILVGQQVLAGLELQVIGEHSMQALLAAAAVAELQGLSKEQIADGLRNVVPVAGRMQPLRGAAKSLLIDDTYNASPEAGKAALDVLYGLGVARRIAILGSMNEMGEYSQQAHREVGEYCDPAKLELVVTVGAEAGQYLAPAAESKGCAVKHFTSPYEAGMFVRRLLLSGEDAPAAVLGKGSQNGVFCEEALKLLLADPADANRLVRQSDYWMSRKQAEFSTPPNSDPASQPA